MTNSVIRPFRYSTKVPSFPELTIREVMIGYAFTSLKAGSRPDWLLYVCVPASRRIETNRSSCSIEIGIRRSDVCASREQISDAHGAAIKMLMVVEARMSSVPSGYVSIWRSLGEPYVNIVPDAIFHL
jgi:hypothetical protein